MVPENTHTCPPPTPPHRRMKEIPRERGMVEQKFSKESMELNCYFAKGGRGDANQTAFHEGGGGRGRERGKGNGYVLETQNS